VGNSHKLQHCSDRYRVTVSGRADRWVTATSYSTAVTDVT